MVADASFQDPGDGVGLAKALHERNPDTKCFLIVDRESPNLLRSVEEEPWLCFIHKPIHMLQFASEVVDAIAKSRVRKLLVNTLFASVF
jgi:hypothetical protein